MPEAPHLPAILRRLLPGVVLPSVVYLVASRFLPMLPSVAMASAVPIGETTFS